MKLNLALVLSLLAIAVAPGFAQGLSPQPTQAPMPKPIGRWGFDSIESGGKLKSSIGGGSGKVSGGKIVDGRVGKALGFSYTGTVASVPVGLARKKAKEITVALWIYVEGAETAEYGPIFECGQNRGLMIRTMFNRSFSLNYAGVWHLKNPSISKTPNKMAPVQLKRWTYLTMTYDGKVGCFYLDGKLAEPECPAVFTPQFNDDAVLGRLGYGMIDNVELGKEERKVQFVGRMDDLQVFDKALTPEQVKLLYEQAKTDKPASGSSLGLLP